MDGEILFGLLFVAALVVIGYVAITAGKQSVSKSNSSQKKGTVIYDRFRNLDEVQAGLREAGLESSNLIIGIDYTASNDGNGMKTFGGRPLHFIDSTQHIINPYEEVINVVGRTLEAFDDDKIIPAFGFGDSTTKDRAVFPFFDNKECLGFQEVATRYRQITPLLSLSGPTSFAPLIYKAIDIVRETKQYHILVIVADGQVIRVKETIQAIVDASNWPLSILMVGVGDGPWDTMHEFDDQIPARKFDNFQFVNHHEVKQTNPTNGDAAFATAALMEIPDQYKEIRRLGLLDL